jgi:hypothetical protein
MTQMGFVYEFIGRPATALDLMNVIRDKLIAAGWTLLREYQDASGNNYKFLMCAPYICLMAVTLGRLSSSLGILQELTMSM